MAKKPFKQTFIGRILRGFVKDIPVVGQILDSALSPADAIDRIVESEDLTQEQKTMLRVKIIDLEKQEIERDIVAQKEVTNRWTSDNTAGTLTRFIRPITCIVLTLLMLFFTYLDSADAIAFHVEEKWVTFWQLSYMTVLGGYFVGKSVEKTFKK